MTLPGPVAFLGLTFLSSCLTSSREISSKRRLSEVKAFLKVSGELSGFSNLE